MRPLDFLSLPNPFSRDIALEFTQPLTVPENVSGGKALPARMSDNLTSICEPII
jgi:hypothetical protein